MKYVLVIGAGKSGKAVCQRLSDNGLLPVLFDIDFISAKSQAKWVEDAEYIIVSPSVKEDSEVVVRARELGKTVIGEIEFAYQNSIGCYKSIVGVTGTNGKTTVVSMLGHILKDESLVAGNIGIPWSKHIGKNYKNCILELSSFQLMTVDKFKSNIVCFLNLSPDHIDFHGSIENYYKAKLNLLKNLTKKDYCVLNAEDDVLMAKVKTDAKTIYFGFNNILNGCFVKEGAIYLKEGGKEKFVLDLSILKSSLRHNIMNVMAVVCILSKLEANIYHCIYKILSYQYSPYRMADCGFVKGVRVFNDSKSTNVASTLAGLKAVSDYKRVALIIGGRYKNESFKEIFAHKHIDTIYIFGESASIIKTEAEECSFKKIKVFDDLVQIVEDIFQVCKYDCVLFSPACASFDMYSSYIERGKHFDLIIKKYMQQTH
ncbi:MAG: UDP-N-acetylmuramoyl-L-alanine--D-glutamate ligase [Clostridia bacterium]|nr:UDP-N-acetylmuramoyl-L-alanine--D-glutamate ligase [Clostridia bacterium]